MLELLCPAANVCASREWLEKRASCYFYVLRHHAEGKWEEEGEGKKSWSRKLKVVGVVREVGTMSLGDCWKQLSWFYYQYLLVTALYMLEPWERTVFSILYYFRRANGLTLANFSHMSARSSTWLLHCFFVRIRKRNFLRWIEKNVLKEMSWVYNLRCSKKRIRVCDVIGVCPM